MWYLQHGRSKGWEDSADAKNRKCPSFTAGFCYPKNSAGTADPPKQDIGCLLGDFGIIFLLHSASSSARARKMWLVFRGDNPCQLWRTRSVNVQPSPCFGDHPTLPISPPHRHFSRWKFGPLGGCRKTRFTGYNNSLKTSESNESWKAVLSFRGSVFLKTHTSFKSTKWMPFLNIWVQFFQFQIDLCYEW